MLDGTRRAPMPFVLRGKRAASVAQAVTITLLRVRNWRVPVQMTGPVNGARSPDVSDRMGSLEQSRGHGHFSAKQQ